MANLNKYDKNKQQEQQQSTTDKLANQAKHQVKQKAKKEAKNKAKDVFHKATDLRQQLSKQLKLLPKELKH